MIVFSISPVIEVSEWLMGRCSFIIYFLAGDPHVFAGYIMYFDSDINPHQIRHQLGRYLELDVEHRYLGTERFFAWLKILGLTREE